MSEVIRVVLVDDHPAVRQGLASVLLAQPDMEVVGQYGRAEDVLDEVHRTKPDIVVLDVRLPGMSGIDACARLRRRHPGIRSILLTSYPSDEAIIAAFSADARGFLLKESTDPHTFSLAVRSVSNGDTFIDPRVGGRVASMLRKKVKTAGPFGLTVQEIRVLALLRQRLTNAEIAERLHLSIHTVKSHLHHAFRKLGVRNRAEAAAIADQEGIEWKGVVDE